MGTITESGEYSSFILDNSANLVIAEDVTLYITDDFVMGNDSQIEVAEGVEVKMFFGGGFKQKNGAQLNNPSRDPKKLLILGTDSFVTMDWKNGSDFWGAIYIPKAGVMIDNSSQFYGALVAKDILIQSSGGIHYDIALKESNIFGDMDRPLYVVKSWQQTSANITN